MRTLFILLLLSGCGGQAWNTTVADHPQVRSAMLASLEPGKTTETRFMAQWGQPTQKIREGAQTAYIYRNMTNPVDHLFPQFGDSNAYVVVLFQYGIATSAYSSDTEGCRATFAPRPPGAHFFNPTTVKPVNCGALAGAGTGRDKGVLAILRDYAGNLGKTVDPAAATVEPLNVVEDSYPGTTAGKYR